jgi:hypothetical protein
MARARDREIAVANGGNKTFNVSERAGHWSTLVSSHGCYREEEITGIGVPLARGKLARGRSDIEGRIVANWRMGERGARRVSELATGAGGREGERRTRRVHCMLMLMLMR